MLAVVAACTTSRATSPSTIPAQLRGDWSGTLTMAAVGDSNNHVEPRDSIRVRVVISDTSTRVYSWIYGWVEITPGRFGITVHDTNAVLVSITAGKDNVDNWVSTWALTLSQVDEQHLRAMIQSQLNNRSLPRSDPGAVKDAIAFGVLERE